LGIEVRQANAADIALLVPLFDAYRLFYRQESDLEGARRFLMERLNHNQSVIFLAFHDDAAIGFTQLYPSFSSAAMARIYILLERSVRGPGGAEAPGRIGVASCSRGIRKANGRCPAGPLN